MTTRQIRDVVERLIVAGQWREGDPEILVVPDAGYDAPRIAHLLADLPVQILGRMRSDRVLRRPAPPGTPGTNGRPPNMAASLCSVARQLGALNTRRPAPACASARQRPHRRGIGCIPG
ncbi:transposase [Amycolatopsis acidiphila]|uniref:transposase n=1 Tax=Amycolatopsis acidiphila TaxID=715473 RepID=UPI002279E010